METKKFIFVIHGGAGTIARSINGDPYIVALKQILKDTYEFAIRSSSLPLTAVDIVEFAVKQLENNELFNAGKGAVFTSDASK